jgi:uncharacterized Tic20 family protein
MPHRDDPFAPEPEEAPTKDSGATEVEAERVERGNAEEGLRTIEATDEPTSKGANTQTWAVLAHLGPLILLLFGISMPLVFLVPLVLLHTVGVGDPEIEHHAKESMNFHLNVALLSLVLTMTCVLIPLLFPLWITALALGLVASLSAAKDEAYRYPWIYRVVE